MSASSGNMTSLSSKRVEKIAKKYKSENTEEVILNKTVIYWLYDDIKSVKIKASEVDGVQEPVDIIPDPDDPQPPPVEKVLVADPIVRERGNNKRRSHFHTMYLPRDNATIEVGGSAKRSSKGNHKVSDFLSHNR